MLEIDLRNKVAIVTGAGRGIGKAIASELVNCGAKVAAVDISAADLQEAYLDISAEHVMTIVCDVTCEDDVTAMTEQVFSRFGHIDILVNNAGTSTMDFMVNTKSTDWDKVMDINAKGSMLCSKYVARQLLKQGIKGKIINIASQAGKNGYRCMGSYCASKHAVIGLTKVMAVELAANNINVNAVCPGIIETEMKWRERREGAVLRGITAQDIADEDNGQVPMLRTGKPEEVAYLVCFLASPLSDYMTGQAINITGGMTTH